MRMLFGFQNFVSMLMYKSKDHGFPVFIDVIEAKEEEKNEYMESQGSQFKWN